MWGKLGSGTLKHAEHVKYIHTTRVYGSLGFSQMEDLPLSKSESEDFPRGLRMRYIPRDTGRHLEKEEVYLEAVMADRKLNLPQQSQLSSKCEVVCLSLPVGASLG